MVAPVPSRGKEWAAVPREEQIDGLRFDYGPYKLLDKPGLCWVFRELDVLRRVKMSK